MVVLKVATVPYDPFMHYHEGNDSWTGTCFELLQELEKDLNLTFEIFKVQGWGTKTNGSWNGMIGAVVRGEADMAGKTRN